MVVSKNETLSFQTHGDSLLLLQCIFGTPVVGAQGIIVIGGLGVIYGEVLRGVDKEHVCGQNRCERECTSSCFMHYTRLHCTVLYHIVPYRTILYCSGSIWQRLWFSRAKTDRILVVNDEPMKQHLGLSCSYVHNISLNISQPRHSALIDWRSLGIG